MNFVNIPDKKAKKNYLNILHMFLLDINFNHSLYQICI